MGKILASVVLSLSAAAFSGCTSFRCNQTESFIDDDGNVVHVEYGELSRPYSYTMVSPMNGKTVECESRTLVKVELPSEEWIVCRICQNPFPNGTMYMTKNGKWRYYTMGLECAVYLEDEDKTDYLLVFKGTAFQDERSGLGSTR